MVLKDLYRMKTEYDLMTRLRAKANNEDDHWQ